jgi:putative hydrolase of the HAD superfamily
VIFDFIGTLVEVKNYSLQASKMKLHRAILEAGFNISVDNFLQAYDKAHEKYRITRYDELIEVTNAVWITEALNDLGFKIRPHDPRIEKTVNIFFEDYLNSLELRPCATGALEQVSENYRLGLISNFTYAPVIHAGLKKLDINHFFHAILVSQEVGWRKPRTEIFQEALRRLEATAQETVYVGDSPLEDIRGARNLGMKTVFVPSQFYSLETLRESQQKPDLIVEDVCDLCDKFRQFVNRS